MSVEVKIPAVGESITSGLLSTWHKNDGETRQRWRCAPDARDRQGFNGDHRRKIRTIANQSPGWARGEDWRSRGHDRRRGPAAKTPESAAEKKPQKAVAPLVSPASVAPAHTMKAAPVPVERPVDEGVAKKGAATPPAEIVETCTGEAGGGRRRKRSGLRKKRRPEQRRRAPSESRGEKCRRCAARSRPNW